LVWRDAKDRIFPENTAQTFTALFPHWYERRYRAVVPFSARNDGADFWLKPAYLMQGLLTARQYFNGASGCRNWFKETDINTLWNNVKWDLVQAKQPEHFILALEP